MHSRTSTNVLLSILKLFNQQFYSSVFFSLKPSAARSMVPPSHGDNNQRQGNNMHDPSLITSALNVRLFPERSVTEERRDSGGTEGWFRVVQGGRFLPANCVFLALWLPVIWLCVLSSADTAAPERSAPMCESTTTTLNYSKPASFYRATAA